MDAPHELSAVVEGNTVVVDVSGLVGVAHTALLVPVVVVAVVVAGLVSWRARPDQRPFLLGALGTGTLGAACALLSAPIVVGRLAGWIPGLTARIAEGGVVVGLAGFCCGALVCLVPLAFVTAPRRVAVVVAVVGVVAFVVGVAGVVAAQDQRRTFIRGLQQAFPVPQLVFAGQEPGGPLPEVQVGRTRDLAPVTYWQLGVRQTVLFGVLGEQPVAFPASDVAAWHLLDVRAALHADSAGEHEATAVATQGPVKVIAPLRFKAVVDAAPPSFPLTPGTSLRFARTTGRPGTTAAVAAQQTATAKKKQKKPKPLSADVVVDVVAERVEDGFRVVTVHVDDRGIARSEDVVAKDGVVYRRGGGDVFVAGCALPFLEQPTCSCGENGVVSCARVDGDSVGALVRVGLLIATLGISEVMGACDGCGDGREVGLIRLP